MSPSRRLTFGHRFACLALAYALLASLCAPLAPRGAAAASASAAAAAPAAGRRPSARDGELLVRFRDGVAEHEREALIGARRGRQRGVLRGASGVERVELSASLPPEVAAAELRSLPTVEFAEPNYLVRAEQAGSADPRFEEQWALRNAGQTGGTAGSDIGAEAAWQKSTGSRRSVIAVIDSGVDFSHPDLANNRWANPGETENGRDDDRDGYADDLSGWDWVAQSGEVTDPNGHGTSVAGVVAAEGGNGTGVAGVMWRASLMSLRVLDETGTGDVAAAVEAIDYAVARGASVINLSWGTGGESRALRDAIARAGRRGVLVVCSAGNAGRSIDSEAYYPASFDLPNLIAVAATDNSDRRASWSNWGARSVGVAAPGADILTTQSGGGYHVVSGTSAAAPHVSGVAGLVKSLYPGLGAEGVRAAILRGVRRVAWLDGAVAGAGVVAAAGALDAAGALPPGGAGGSGGRQGGGQGNGNGQGGAGDGNGGGWHGQSPQPGAPGRGSGGRGPGGSFDVEPPAPYRQAPPGFGDQDEIRRARRPAPKAPAFMSADNLALPVCDADCGDSYPAGGAIVTHPTDPRFGTGRTRLENETGQPGEDLGSRNFNWGLPLVSLAGRAGLDLSVSLYYNSLVWTKQDRTVQFNGDHGFPGPGFRLGFPVLQGPYYDHDTNTNAYVLVTPSGGRVEMRQIGTYVYESADGTYTRLTIDGAGTVVRTTDGTQLSFVLNPSQAEYRCTQIKDRNGNFITVNYDQATAPGQLGRPTSVVDTLGRTVNFNYDANHYLASITQSWTRDTPSGLGAPETHAWATFDYDVLAVWPNFADEQGELMVYGPQGGAQIPVLKRVGLPDGTYYEFDYTPWGQVNRINRRAPNGWLLARTAYGLSSDTSPVQSDCPRVTERREWAEWWNGDTGDHAVAPAEEAVTTYNVDPGGAWARVVPPDPTPNDPSDDVVYKEHFATSGWRKGLTERTEAYHPSNPLSPMKWTIVSWTQDDETLAYAKNPRVGEVNVYDSNNNRRRTRYQYGTAYNLPAIVYEYAADGSTLLRQTNFAYDLGQHYVDRRVIGLVSAREVYDVSTGSYVLAARTTYTYDSTPLQNHGAVTAHDGSAYGTNFQHGRGNLTAVHRFDTAEPHNMAKASASTAGYDTAGSVVWQEDASAHRTSYDYSAPFTDGSTHNAYAFPTKVTDPDGFYSTAQYNYSMGALFKAVDPKGAERKSFYDAAGRLGRAENNPGGSHTDYTYDPYYGYFITETALEDNRGLAYTNTIVDGRGRARVYAASHPNSAGGYLAVMYGYDALGRQVERTNPTEMYGSGHPAGDDAAGGFRRTLQSYDWQGRPRVTTYPTGNTVEVSYGGCGCAGGEVSTVRDERGRRKRYTKDVLGRLAKVEELNWNESVYATTDYSYNARDQIEEINQAGQLRTFDYDGHGRLWKRTTPEQGPVEYAYNGDDTVWWAKDARGAKTVFGYNDRHLPISISYDLTGVVAGQNVAPTAGVTMGYDSAGNRTSMTDGLGNATYSYDMLSRLDWEERRFNGVAGPNNGAFGLDYDYNRAGQLVRVKNPWGVEVSYEHDAEGRTTAVRGTNTAGSPTYAGVATYAHALRYRAFGALKSASYGNNHTFAAQYDFRLRLTQWNVASVHGYDYHYDNFSENSFRVTYAQHIGDPTLNRSFDYDEAGRLWEAHSGNEADAHVAQQPFPSQPNGPFSHSYRYDQFGNETYRVGWGGYFGSYTNQYQAFTGNRRDGLTYDLAGNLTYDGTQYAYDAQGQQATTAYPGYLLSQAYDGDGLRAAKVENGATTYYLRSSALGGQVVAEVNAAGAWSRGYVYGGGGELLALQYASAVQWVHQDPVTKGQRLTDASGTVTAAIDLDPWGGETSRSWQQHQQPRRFTTYERDGAGNDYATFRQYHGGWHRFAQPDPYEGSYSLADPQSFNRYSYTQNDPVNFTDPTGLDPGIGYPFRCVNCHLFGDSYAGLGSLIGGGGIGGAGSGLFGGVVIAGEEGADGPGGGVGGPQQTAQENAYPGCITGNWLLNHPEIKRAFDFLWQKSEQAQKEMGGWIFFEVNKNTIHLIKAPSDGDKTSMPNESSEFKAQVDQFQQEKREMLFIGMFHTHPHPNQSQYPSTFWGDMDVIRDRNNVRAKGGAPPLGVVIYGPGKYTPYDQGAIYTTGVSKELSRCL